MLHVRRKETAEEATWVVVVTAASSKSIGRDLGSVLFVCFHFSCGLKCLNGCLPTIAAFLCSSVPAGCSDLHSLDSLSPQEKKRQGYIHELIDTEDRYVTDLQIVLEVTDARPAELILCVWTCLLMIRADFQLSSCLCLFVGVLQADVGVWPLKRLGDCHDLCQLERTAGMQHQTSEVNIIL